nr:MAG TPA: protein of unknown function DUF617 [Caudoviricetes sp.]
MGVEHVPYGQNQRMVQLLVWRTYCNGRSSLPK